MSGLRLKLNNELNLQTFSFVLHPVDIIDNKNKNITIEGVYKNGYICFNIKESGIYKLVVIDKTTKSIHFQKNNIYFHKDGEKVINIDFTKRLSNQLKVFFKERDEFKDYFISAREKLSTMELDYNFLDNNYWYLLGIIISSTYVCETQHYIELLDYYYTNEKFSKNQKLLGTLLVMEWEFYKITGDDSRLDRVYKSYIKKVGINESLNQYYLLMLYYLMKIVKHLNKQDEYDALLKKYYYIKNNYNTTKWISNENRYDVCESKLDFITNYGALYLSEVPSKRQFRNIIKDIKQDVYNYEVIKSGTVVDKYLMVKGLSKYRYYSLVRRIIKKTIIDINQENYYDEKKVYALKFIVNIMYLIENIVGIKIENNHVIFNIKNNSKTGIVDFSFEDKNLTLLSETINNQLRVIIDCNYHFNLEIDYSDRIYKQFEIKPGKTLITLGIE